MGRVVEIFLKGAKQAGEKASMSEDVSHASYTNVSVTPSEGDVTYSKLFHVIQTHSSLPLFLDQNGVY